MANTLVPASTVTAAIPGVSSPPDSEMRRELDLQSQQPANTKQSKLVLVVGMHRSGTSAVTRGLKTLGVELGDRLWPPNEAVNAKGFWEDMDINALNIEMMKALNTDWHYLSPIKDAEIELLRSGEFFSRASELLRAKFGDSTQFGFKDPRVAKLLPFWKEVVAHCQYDGKYLIMTRHPLSVVASLRRREGFDAEKSYLLWLVHMLECLGATNGCRRVLVDFDRLMQDPERELTRIGSAFSLAVNAEAMATYISDFLDEDLRHTTFQPEELAQDIACMPLVRDVYAALLLVAADEMTLDGEDFQQRLARWQVEFARLEPSLRLVDKLFATNISVNAAVAEKHHALYELGERAASLANEIAAQVEVDRAREKMIVDRDEVIATMRATLALSEVEISNLHQVLSANTAQIAALNQTITQREKLVLEERVALETAIFSLRQESLKLNLALSESQHALAQIKRSVSWRIFKPMRNLSAWREELSHKRDAKQSAIVNVPETEKNACLQTGASEYEALIQYQGRAFIVAAYSALLKRAPDPGGLDFYLSRLQSGVGKLQILHELFSSLECRQAGVELPGLHDALSRAMANLK